jgi:transcriptional regulator with XRE-family HTH domain
VVCVDALIRLWVSRAVDANDGFGSAAAGYSTRGAVLRGLMALTIEDLGRLIAAKRGGRGVRATAIDVGISAATLSRIENGHMPDLETFAKISR